MDRARLPPRIVAVLLPLALAAGGGSISFGIGIGDGFDEEPPTVTISSPVTTIQPGQPITFVAAASDPESGIDDVIFYRVDGGVFTSFGSDGSAPYERTTTAPADGRTTLVVFARARDNAGNTTDSASITITITVTPLP